MSGKIKAATIRETEDSSVMTIVNGDLTTSGKIRALAAEGVDRSTIAELLGKRYQHVRNVLVVPLTGGRQAS